MDFKEAIREYAELPLSRQVIFGMLRDYSRPYDKVSELVRQGILVPVKRGTYIPGKALRMEGPGSHLLANHIYGPSYVSMETALSYWGLIPEKVYETSSATVKTSTRFATAAGRFSYTHLPLPYYSFGIQRVELTSKQAVLIASPEKALCDKIVTTTGILLRSSKQVMEFLEDDLRIDLEGLRSLDYGTIGQWIKEAPKSASLEMLTKTLSNL